jgi:hypothetical protein
MLATLLRLVGVDLRLQLSHLLAQAEAFKSRTTREIQQKVAEASLTIGIAFAGLFFVMLTVVVALVALYLWVEIHRGPFAALAVVGLATVIMAAVAFAIVAARNPRQTPKLAMAARCGRCRPLLSRIHRPCPECRRLTA